MYRDLAAKIPCMRSVNSGKHSYTVKCKECPKKLEVNFQKRSFISKKDGENGKNVIASFRGNMILALSSVTCNHLLLDACA